MAYWSNAVREASEDVPADLETAARAELADLWFDLHVARYHAMDGRWSMECDNTVRRIVHLSRLVGATPWAELPENLLSDGTYQGILTEAAVEFEPPDMTQVREVRRYIADQSCPNPT